MESHHQEQETQEECFDHWINYVASKFDSISKKSLYWKLKISFWEKSWPKGKCWIENAEIPTSEALVTLDWMSQHFWNSLRLASPPRRCDGCGFFPMDINLPKHEPNDLSVGPGCLAAHEKWMAGVQGRLSKPWLIYNEDNIQKLIYIFHAAPLPK